jgi:AraC-like DNA-binding protein
VPTRRHDSAVQDFVDFSRRDGLEGLEIMRARWVKQSFPVHAHDFYNIALNYRGGGAFDCRGAQRDALPGTCNLMAPGELHTGQVKSEDGWVYRSLHISPQLFGSMLQAIDFPGPLPGRFKSPLSNDTVLAQRLVRTFESFEHESSLLGQESLLFSVVERLLSDHIERARVSADERSEPMAIRRVREWLDEHPAENVSSRMLADLVGLSPWYLVRAFKRYQGVPPHRYQTMVRVNKARTLLLAGGRLAEVAALTGFFDQSHLNRCFKSVLGTSPGRYLSGSPASIQRDRATSSKTVVLRRASV